MNEHLKTQHDTGWYLAWYDGKEKSTMLIQFTFLHQVEISNQQYKDKTEKMQAEEKEEKDPSEFNLRYFCRVCRTTWSNLIPKEPRRRKRKLLQAKEGNHK